MSATPTTHARWQRAFREYRLLSLTDAELLATIELRSNGSGHRYRWAIGNDWGLTTDLRKAKIAVRDLLPHVKIANTN
mgnify:CR=1 FL=1